MAEQEDGAEEEAVKLHAWTRSLSLRDTAATSTAAGDSRFPPVLVMFHPTMKEMATKLVRTTERLLQVKLLKSAANSVSIN